MYGRQGGRVVAPDDTPELEELRAVAGGPCPGCGQPSGYWSVAARVFDVDAKSGAEVYTCQECHARAHEASQVGRRSGESWAGALAP